MPLKFRCAEREPDDALHAAHRRELMQRENLTFREALNRAIRAGLGARAGRRFRQRTFELGVRPDILLDKALRITGDVEDQEILRRLALSK